MRKIFIIIMISFLLIYYNPNKLIFAQENPLLTANSLTLRKGESYNLNINNKIPNSKYKWYVDNNKIVSINSKNGVIKGVNIGKTTVICKIVIDNRKITLKCNVVVIDDPIFFQYKLIAHALGGYEGHIYNNTEEALINSINNNFKFIEVDMTLTSDNELVCSHGWDKNTYEITGVLYDEDNPEMDYQTFMDTKIQGKHKTIDATTIYKYMKSHPYIYFEIDLKKFDYDRTVILTHKLLEAFNNDAEVLDRLLIQVYDEEAYYAVNSVYSFKFYQYFVLKAELKDMNKVVNFCKENNIVSVAINYKNIDNSIVNTFKSKGIYVLAHTVDDPDTAKELLDMGVNVICSNFLIYDDLKPGTSSIWTVARLLP